MALNTICPCCFLLHFYSRALVLDYYNCNYFFVSWGRQVFSWAIFQPTFLQIISASFQLHPFPFYLDLEFLFLFDYIPHHLHVQPFS